MPFVPISDASAFGRAVMLGQTSETRLLEFKSEYRWQKDKATPDDHKGLAEELCRDVAQFANTDGGVLLVGITEQDLGGRRVADSINPIANVNGFKEWAEQAIRNHLVPATFSRSMNEIVLPDGTILAINVQPSLHLIGLWHKDGKKGIEYLYRTDHGKEWFNPDEVERHIMNGSRAIRIRLARLIDELSKNPNDQIRVALTPAAELWVTRQGSFGQRPLVFLAASACSEDEIELRVGSVCVRLSHGMVAEAWKTSDRQLGLFLKVGIVVTEKGEVTLSPVAMGR